MSKRWIRELQLGDPGAWTTDEAKFRAPAMAGAGILSRFLEDILGWTYITGFNDTNYRELGLKGTAGSFSGVDKNFTDLTSPYFGSANLLHDLVVTSPTNWNGSMFRMLSLPGGDPGNIVTIDTRTGATEYPAAESGLTWYMHRHLTSPSDGDWIRYLSPAGWGIEILVDCSLNYRVFAIRISPNNIWTGLGAKVLGPVYVGQGGSNYPDLTIGNWRFFAIGETDGSFLQFWLENAAYGGVMGFTVGSITPVEAGHSSDELLTLTGTVPVRTSANDQSRSSVWFRRDTSEQSSLANAFVWIDRMSTQQKIYAMENAYGAIGTGFSKKGGEINQRTGLNDFINGTLYMLDWANSVDEYEYLGYLYHHKSCRNTIARKTALDVDATKDGYHIADGIVVPWPGVTPQL